MPETVTAQPQPGHPPQLPAARYTNATRELKRLQTKAKVILTTKRSMFKDSQEYKALGSLRKRIRLYEGMLEAGWDTPITLPEVLLERPSGKKKFRRGPAARHPFPFGWELENERRHR